MASNVLGWILVSFDAKSGCLSRTNTSCFFVLSTGTTDINNETYWRLSPIVLLNSWLNRCIFAASSLYAICKGPNSTSIWYSLMIRSRITSKCNSPIPDRTVCPVSMLLVTRKLGSSRDNWDKATSSCVWYDWLGGSIEQKKTGSGIRISGLNNFSIFLKLSSLIFRFSNSFSAFFLIFFASDCDVVIA